MSYIIIDHLEDMAFLNQELLNKTHLGVDTEFRRTNKDNMRLALLQVNDEDETYLIDAISIDDPGPHVSFLFRNQLLRYFIHAKGFGSNFFLTGQKWQIFLIRR